MATLDSTKAILGDLIAYPSVSSDSNVGVIGYLAQRLQDIGADVQLQFTPDGQKANLFATLGPAGDGGIVLSGHSDVVPVAGQDWTHDPFTMTERDGRLYGRGTCDMKGFIAACIAKASDYATLPLTRSSGLIPRVLVPAGIWCGLELVRASAFTGDKISVGRCTCWMTFATVKVLPLPVTPRST